ncbi:MarR family winged helix-turn-helix transcriptional regulator [Mycolicibacterium pulveris]|uniref:MarR family winged helix-turn-helix transcriptional regulator n=1 Tax=Mycolicibacterium pulveris TaxID=36813 RepID=UPI003CEED08A
MTSMHSAPADSGEDALVAQVDEVLRASRAIVGIVATSLAGVDEVVTVPQLRTLVMVHTRGPLNLGAVAAGLGVNPSNASRTCDRLIQAGLLDRRESTVDRRNITLSLTAAGRRLVEKVTKRRRKEIERVLSTMTPGERSAVGAAMAAFASAAGEPEDEARLLALMWPATP